MAIEAEPWVQWRWTGPQESEQEVPGNIKKLTWRCRNIEIKSFIEMKSKRWNRIFNIGRTYKNLDFEGTWTSFDVKKT